MGNPIIPKAVTPFMGVTAFFAKFNHKSQRFTPSKAYPIDAQFST
jgi:hypothetical protein